MRAEPKMPVTSSASATSTGREAPSRKPPGPTGKRSRLLPPKPRRRRTWPRSCAGRVTTPRPRRSCARAWPPLPTRLASPWTSRDWSSTSDAPPWRCRCSRKFSRRTPRPACPSSFTGGPWRLRAGRGRGAVSAPRPLRAARRRRRAAPGRRSPAHPGRSRRSRPRLGAGRHSRSRQRRRLRRTARDRELPEATPSREEGATAALKSSNPTTPRLAVVDGRSAPSPGPLQPPGGECRA